MLVLAATQAALLQKPGWTGAILGISVFAKATNILYAPAWLAFFLLNRNFRGALKLCLFAAIPLVFYLALNTYMFGSPLLTSYHRILVREAGQLGTHSIVADFHFSALLVGLKRVLLSDHGFLKNFPLIFLAPCGLIALVIAKRWREALMLAWCLAVPIAFHAPYSWYRLDFNLPQIALSVTLLAALLVPLAGPTNIKDPPSRIHWKRLGTVIAIVILVVVGFGRQALTKRNEFLWAHLPQASVSLGNIPCDYFNNQTERWACSHFDDDPRMTGRVLGQDLIFAGKPERVLIFSPHPSGQERRLEYSQVPLKKAFRLRYGLADRSKPEASVHLQALINDVPVLQEDVRQRQLLEKELDTSAFAGQQGKITLVVTSPSPDDVVFGINGSPR